MLDSGSPSALPALPPARNLSDPTRVGWQPAPGTRGTIEIMWTCAVTMFACTWACLHPDVQSSRDDWRKNALRKFKWTVVMILAPEYVTASACVQLRQARAFLEKVKTHLQKGTEEGGIREGDIREENIRGGSVRRGSVKEGDVERGGNAPDGDGRGGQHGDSPIWSMSHAFFVIMGGMTYQVGEEIKTLDATRLLEILRKQSVKFTKFTHEDIEHRSKAHRVVKALACIQISWFGIQCIGRFITGLPITELELSTCAFVLYALPIYVAWWRKPKDIYMPIQVDLLPEADVSYLPSRADEPHPADHWGNDYIMTGLQRVLIASFLGIPFSAIHCAAWNFDFPTAAERSIWRVCSVTATAAPAAIGFVLLLHMFTLVVVVDEPIQSLVVWASDASRWLSVILVLVYIAVRLVVLVQIFLCFRSMPSGVYQRLRWVDYIFHI